MNFNLEIISGSQLPLALPENAINPCVVIKQTALKPLQIGVTGAYPNNPNPVWNSSIQFHAIRGLSFDLDIVHHRQGGQQLIVGTAHVYEGNIALGVQQKIPVIPTFISSTLPNGWKPTITVSISMIPNVQPIMSPIAGGPLIPQSIIYANLAFAPEFSPTLPTYKQLPLDLTLIAFRQDGSVKNWLQL